MYFQISHEEVSCLSNWVTIPKFHTLEDIFKVLNAEVKEHWDLSLPLQGAKLAEGHLPLYASGLDPNAKQFASLHAVQRHMVDTNQCKMAYDGTEEEYEDFYDYTKALEGHAGEPSPSEKLSKQHRCSVRKWDGS